MVVSFNLGLENGMERSQTNDSVLELDASNNASARSAAEATFIKAGKTYQTSLYSGAEHGFAVRTNLTDPRKKFAQEGAYVQAVRWFDTWIK
jgi:dienelactone hydrolase